MQAINLRFSVVIRILIIKLNQTIRRYTGDGSNTPPSPPTTERSDEGFPNTSPSPPTTELPSQGLNTPSSLPTVENPVLSTEEATDVLGAKPIPKPSAILGLAAAGAGLLAAKFKALSKKK